MARKMEQSVFVLEQMGEFHSHNRVGIADKSGRAVLDGLPCTLSSDDDQAAFRRRKHGGGDGENPQCAVGKQG